MSFQAYLDNAEKQTGIAPNEFIELARKQGFTGETKSGEILKWLKEEYKLGHGHASAVVYVIKNGAKIGDKHVNSGSTHSDPSDTLRLDGLKNR